MNNADDGRSTGDNAALIEALSRVFSVWASTHSLLTLDECIDICQRLIPKLDEGKVEHGNAVLQLAELLGSRWASSRSDSQWAHASGLIDGFRAGIPPADWREPLYALAQGALLYRRADVTQAPDDIANALGRLQEARSTVRYGSFVHRYSSLYQCNLRLRRFEAEREPIDLEAALLDSGDVLGSEHVPPPHVVSAAKTFARAAYLRADLARDSGYIDPAVEAVRRALALTGDPFETSDLQGALASLLSERFAREGIAADIDAAIDAYRAALQVQGLPEEVLAARIDNLGNGLAKRHNVAGDVADLDEAVLCHRRALRLSLPRSPGRAKMHVRLASALLACWRSRRDSAALEETITTLTAGLRCKVTTGSTIVELNGLMLDALLASELASGVDAVLDRAIAAGEAALRAYLQSEGDDPVAYRLAARQRVSPIARRLMGALLRRAARDSAVPGADLRRAVVIGEATKVPMLTHELLRRTLAAPAGVAEGDLSVEKRLLAELAAYDVHEMAPADGLGQARRLRRIAQRGNAWAALQRVWRDIAATGTAGEQYVGMRRDLSAALDSALQQRPRDWLLLSMLDIEELSSDGRWQSMFCVIALPPGEASPAHLICRGPHAVVDHAQKAFLAQVIDDPDADLSLESWWHELGALFGGPHAAETVQIMFSTNAGGLNLPWPLLFERCGWRGTEGTMPAAVVVPSLVLAAENGDSDAEAWHELRNAAQHFGIQDDASVAENVRVSLRMPAAPSRTALVVGDPLADLDDAHNEAVRVAQTLSVKPLLGPAATIAAVREGFHNARIVHIAAHASFNELDPLASVLCLADGDLAARDLIGSWSTSELVVLSACESATGAPLLGGEAVGLAIELLRSGAQAVIASLWSVDDEATSYLMQRFYLARAQGRPSARALAMAMTDTQRQPGWKGPHYWAGFVLMQRGFG